MLFTDSIFLLRFLPIVVGLFFLALAVTPRNWRARGWRFSLGNAVLAVGSSLFVACGSGPFIRWIIAAAFLNYLVALAIDRARQVDDDRVGALPEALLTLAVTGNVVLLGAFKYAMPLPVVFNERSFAVPQLLAPFGLTFLACHAISYVADVSRGHMPAQGSPIRAALYLLFFPLLCAGPLVRYRDMGPQLATRRATMAAFAYGVRRWLVGFCKVVLLARNLAGPADAVFRSSAGDLGLLEAWLGTFCFALQIYFQLSGYADMAIGFARMFGIRVVENFRWPYGADTVTEFWRRWNLTLVGWIRTYIGVSHEASEAGMWVRMREIFVVFLVVGFWHGPGWNVVVWGMLHGGFVAFEQLVLGARLDRWPALARRLYCVFVVLLLWVLFRAESVDGAVVVWRAMFFLANPVEPTSLLMTPIEWAALVIGSVAAVPFWPGSGRWLVTVDALTTSILILTSTSIIFVWRQFANTLLFLTGRRR